MTYVDLIYKSIKLTTNYKDYVYGNVITRALNKNKEHYLKCKDKAEIWYDVLRQIQLHMSKYKKIKIYNPLCQTYRPTVV